MGGGGDLKNPSRNHPFKKLSSRLRGCGGRGSLFVCLRKMSHFPSGRRSRNHFAYSLYSSPSHCISKRLDMSRYFVQFFFSLVLPSLFCRIFFSIWKKKKQTWFLQKKKKKKKIKRVSRDSCQNVRIIVFFFMKSILATNSADKHAIGWAVL